MPRRHEDTITALRRRRGGRTPKQGRQAQVAELVAELRRRPSPEEETAKRVMSKRRAGQVLRVNVAFVPDDGTGHDEFCEGLFWGLFHEKAEHYLERLTAEGVAVTMDWEEE